MKMKIFVFAVLIVLFVPIFDAWGYVGNDLIIDLREYEKSERNDPKIIYISVGIYIGFVKGVYESNTNIICAEGIKLKQMNAGVAKYLNEHPEEWNQPAYVLVIKALNKAFPCKE